MLDEQRQGQGPSPLLDAALSTNGIDEEQHDSDDLDDPNAHSYEFTTHQAYLLYTSHTLSMWNSRMYEYGVCVKGPSHLDHLHPDGLLREPFSLIDKVGISFILPNPTYRNRSGIAETVCVLFFSSALGRWVNRAPRLPVLLQTITSSRIAVLVSCLTWFVILSSDNDAYKHIWFALALVLGMIEKLSRITNILSVEREWVPLLANPCPDGTQSTLYSLTHLNTVMRRIDMLCKLIAPLFISALTTSLRSERIVVALVVIINTLSWRVECWCIKKVWEKSNRLKASKDWVNNASSDLEPTSRIQSGMNTDPKDRATARTPNLFAKFYFFVQRIVGADIDGLQYYLSTPVWIPSLCAAVPHASVLTYSGTLITYLLNAGFSLNTVTIARFIGAIFEIASTFIYPWAVRVLSKGNSPTDGRYEVVPQNMRTSLASSTRDQAPEDETVESNHKFSTSESGVVRVGLCGIIVLCLSLLPAVVALFFLGSRTSSSNSPLSWSAFVLCFSLSISLLGRWTYDLSATQLTQTLIPAAHRPSFGGTEMSIVSVLSLGHWIAAAVWHTQNDFRCLAFGSFVLVAIAAGAYCQWARRRKSESGTRVVVNGYDEIELSVI